jgi:hypothetical protein
MRRFLLSVIAIVSIGLASASAVPFLGGYTQTAYNVNVQDFCASSQMTGASDATACIQAAIDTAFSNNIEQVYCPAGANLVTSGPIYQDMPGNLNVRADGNLQIQNPTISNFSMNFTGLGGPNHQGAGKGCNIRPNFNTDVAWWIGPGRGMVLKGVNVLGPSGVAAAGYRCGQPVTATQATSSGLGAWHPAAIAVSQLASNTLIENTWVENFYSGYALGPNGGSLADADTFRKNYFNNNCIGVDNSINNQAFIVDIYDMVGSATTAIESTQGQNVHVYGGNLSAVSGVGNSFTIGSFTNFVGTETSFADSYLYTFQATITSPDTYLTDNVYNAYTIVTPDYGVIPLQMTAFNSGTGVATFQIFPTWGYFYFPSLNNAFSTTTLETEISNVTTLYATEMVTVFDGSNIHVWGGHIENPSAATTFFATTQFFGGFNTASAQGIYFDADPSLTSLRPSNNPGVQGLARYYAQSSFPFVWLSIGQLNLEDIQFDAQGPLNFDFAPYSSSSVNQYVFSSTGNLFASHLTSLDGVNARYPSAAGAPAYFGTQAYPANAPLFGFGSWDTDYFLTTVSTQADKQRSYGYEQSPTWGVRPAAWTRPCLTPSQVSTLTGSLPSIIYTAPGGVGSYGVTYPLIWGGQQYQKCDWYLGSQTYYNLVSNHHGYSYGQSLGTAITPSAISSISGTSSPYTVTLSTTTTYNNGTAIILSGITPGTLNGSCAITSSSTGSFTCTTSGTGTWSSGGTATGVTSMAWSAIGAGFLVNVNDTSLFFPGLQVQLTTSSTNTYIVTGVYPNLGYITVARFSNSAVQVVGVSGTVYTGSSVGQESYSITQY